MLGIFIIYLHCLYLPLLPKHTSHTPACRTKKRSVTLINERNCTSVKPYDKTYCAGDCLEPGFRCRPSKYTSVAVPVTCPGELPFRDHYFEVWSARSMCSLLFVSLLYIYQAAHAKCVLGWFLRLLFPCLQGSP